MAIDTATKRRAVSGIPAHPLGPGVTPDSSQGRAWRAQSAWGYYQVAASDMVVEVQLANLDSDADAECGVCFRLEDTSNFLCAYVDKGDSLLHLSKVVADTETSIATASWTPAATAEMRVIAQGSRLRVWLDFALLIDTTDDTFQDAAKAGLFSRNTTVVQFKNFYAQGLT